MIIEVWSDYVCPFCYIGKRRLEEALKLSKLEDRVDVVFKAYQLDPNTPAGSDLSVIEGLAEKYNVSLEEANNMMQNVVEQAKTVGLEFQVETMKTSNTFDAHRLTKFAEQAGAGQRMTERLLRGHFIEGEAVDSRETLLQIAEECGLNREEVQAMLDSDRHADEVNADIQEAVQIGVRGVPFFVLNRKYAISGAQPVEAFVQALEKVAEEEGVKPAFQMLGDDDSEGQCKDGNCEV